METSVSTLVLVCIYVACEAKQQYIRAFLQKVLYPLLVQQAPLQQSPTLVNAPTDGQNARPATCRKLSLPEQRSLQPCTEQLN